jgi:hypothetical protein
MPIKKGPMAAAVTKSVRKHTFTDKDRWGITLMLQYARQLDTAERIKQEVMEVLEEADTASKTWHQRLVQIEKYVNADSLVNSTGPKLLQVMKEFGLTPTLAKAKTGGDTSGNGTQADPEEDELARIRNRRAEAGSA